MTLREIIFILIILLFVFGIPLTMLAWIISAKMRRKVAPDYEPIMVRENQHFPSAPPEIADEYEESHKLCPKCKSTYMDESIVFCLADGTPLESVVKKSSVNNPPVTEILEKPYASLPTVMVKKNKDKS